MGGATLLLSTLQNYGVSDHILLQILEKLTHTCMSLKYPFWPLTIVGAPLHWGAKPFLRKLHNFAVSDYILFQIHIIEKLTHACHKITNFDHWQKLGPLLRLTGRCTIGNFRRLRPKPVDWVTRHWFWLMLCHHIDFDWYYAAPQLSTQDGGCVVTFEGGEYNWKSITC